MNKQRRQQPNELAEKIRALKDEVETLRDEEQDYYDNMPESFQGGEKGDKAYTLRASAPRYSAKVTCYSTSKQTGILVIRAYLSRFPYSR